MDLCACYSCPGNLSIRDGYIRSRQIAKRYLAYLAPLAVFVLILLLPLGDPKDGRKRNIFLRFLSTLRKALSSLIQESKIFAYEITGIFVDFFKDIYSYFGNDVGSVRAQVTEEIYNPVNPIHAKSIQDIAKADPGPVNIDSSPPEKPPTPAKKPSNAAVAVSSPKTLDPTEAAPLPCKISPATTDVPTHKPGIDNQKLLVAPTSKCACASNDAENCKCEAIIQMPQDCTCDYMKKISNCKTAKIIGDKCLCKNKEKPKVECACNLVKKKWSFKKKDSS